MFLNFSTRPPRLTNFCWPVKNGWHDEQTSSLISGLVDIVINVLPHAQVTLHSTYSGWIPSFMLLPLSCSGRPLPADVPLQILVQYGQLYNITTTSAVRQPVSSANFRRQNAEFRVKRHLFASLETKGQGLFNTPSCFRLAKNLPDL